MDELTLKGITQFYAFVQVKFTDNLNKCFNTRVCLKARKLNPKLFKSEILKLWQIYLIWVVSKSV